MNTLISLVAVLALAFIAYLGAEVAGLQIVFAGVLPYIALLIFIAGTIYRIAFKWGRAPIPFRIPTTCGQQKSLPWIKPSWLDNPHTKLGVVVRVALEVLLFRSLFRNTTSQVVGAEKRVTYGPNVALWAAGLAFHWSMLVIIFRHLRFFTEKVPWAVTMVQEADGFFQIGVPIVYATSVVFLGALTYLFVRRLYSPQLRYISLVNDYFPLFLLLGIGTSGFLLRHFAKTDIVAVKKITIGMLSFSPSIPDGVHYLFYVHLFLITVLFAYLPFSKILHMGGIFMSPTRAMVNNNRAVRHINPWNYPVKVHTYEEYEDDYRDKMIEAGIPVDKQA